MTPGVLLKESGVFLKDHVSLLKDPGILLKAPGVEPHPGEPHLRITDRVGTGVRPPLPNHLPKAPRYAVISGVTFWWWTPPGGAEVLPSVIGMTV